jgi:hypothetical protein
VNIFLTGNRAKYIIAVAFILVVALIAFTAVLQRRTEQSSSTTTQIPIPTTNVLITPGTPSTIPAQSEEYQKSIQIIHNQEAPFIKREAAVGKLLDILPYEGTNFKMENDYQAMQYVVTIKKGKETEGQDEFDAFLKLHEIVDQSWIRKELLRIQVQ